MPCYKPLTAYRSGEKNASGKRSLVFNKAKSIDGIPVEIPCRQCIGCRVDHAQQWAARCVHESTLHRDNCFVTLTYADEHLPLHGSLSIPDVQKFMKRLRRRYPEANIRVFYCGEYGEQERRPHYHALVFGWDAPDKVLISERVSGPPVPGLEQLGPQKVRLFSSEVLREIWGKGLVSVGALTPHSAEYVTRYVVKKRTGPLSEDHYQAVDPHTGECWPIEPEFARMSLRPAIGRGWLDRFAGDVFPADEVIISGKRKRVPRYYLDRLGKVDEAALAALKAKRRERLREQKAKGELKPERLEVREQCAREAQKRRLSKL